LIAIGIVDAKLKEHGVDLDAMSEAAESLDDAFATFVKAYDDKGFTKDEVAAFLESMKQNALEKIEDMRRLRSRMALSYMMFRQYSEASGTPQEDVKQNEEPSGFMAMKRDEAYAMFLRYPPNYEIGPWIAVYDALVGGESVYDRGDGQTHWIAERQTKELDKKVELEKVSSCRRAVKDYLTAMNYADNQSLTTLIFMVVNGMQVERERAESLGITEDDIQAVHRIVADFYPERYEN
jgi:hypothetical protein